MRLLEEKLICKGFRRLQEKEECVYFDKTTENGQTIQNICVVYHRTNKQIQAVHMYTLQENGMNCWQDKQAEKTWNEWLTS